MNYELRTKKGFTLIELVMVIVILGILAGLGIPLTFNLIESFQYSLYRKELSEQADVVLRRIGREIRRLKDPQSVIAAEASSYHFVDIDGQNIQYRLNGTDLERQTAQGTDILAANIAALNFTYLDGRQAPIAAPLAGALDTDIRFIEIDMTIEEGGNTLYYKTKICPRNLPHFSDLFS